MYRDGFLVLKKVVPPDMVTAARRVLNTQLGTLSQTAQHAKNMAAVRQAVAAAAKGAQDSRLLDLFNKTDAMRVVEALFGGPTESATSVQIATRFPADEPMQVNESGYRNKDTPFHGWHGHLDGLWSGGTRSPGIGETFTPHRKRMWYRDPATNGAHRCHPEFNCNMTNFTALVGVALSDQRQEGAGNVGLLKGAHRKMERFFRLQREAGGPLGPDGPGWPREHLEAPNGHGLRHYPDAVRESYKRNAAFTADGHMWPKPTLMKLAPGDVVIVHHATPHGTTFVEAPDPRFMLYFRTTPKSRPQQNRRIYPEALCDIWLEWKGMQPYVKERYR